MKHFATTRNLAVFMGVLACSACASVGSNSVEQTAGIETQASAAGSAENSAIYGDRSAVEAALRTVKSRGTQKSISSRGIRLPQRPLGEIAVYGYQLPQSCGAHEFRVFEADGTQILEYRYATHDGETQTIRDYIKGPSPFVGPGLWSAYDHTEDSISTMRSQVEQRGDRLFKGVYSQGLVTGLADAERRVLGSAYQRALGDAYACQETQTLASTTGE